MFGIIEYIAQGHLDKFIRGFDDYLYRFSKIEYDKGHRLDYGNARVGDFVVFDPEKNSDFSQIATNVKILSTVKRYPSHSSITDPEERLKLWFFLTQVLMQGIKWNSAESFDERGFPNISEGPLTVEEINRALSTLSTKSDDYSFFRHFGEKGYFSWIKM